jgi:hypothetical protein
MKASKRISDINQEAATQNIERKLGVLRTFTISGIPWKTDDSGKPIRDALTGFRTLDFCPVNEFAFAKWTLEPHKNDKYRNCPYVVSLLTTIHGEFISHGPDSLLKRPDLRAQAKTVFNALRKKATAQLADEDSSDQLIQLQKEVKSLKAMAEQEATFVLSAIGERADLQKENAKISRALASARDQIRILQERMDREVASKDAEIAALKKQLAEIRRFGKA